MSFHLNTSVGFVDSILNYKIMPRF